MKIVIEIPKWLHKKIIESTSIRLGDVYTDKLLKSIRNGTPLPKGHGRLIDADELYGDFIDGTEGYDCNTWNRIEIGDIIENAPTIIEAEGSESE